eukprot:gene7408-15130_t
MCILVIRKLWSLIIVISLSLTYVTAFHFVNKDLSQLRYTFFLSDNFQGQYPINIAYDQKRNIREKIALSSISLLFPFVSNAKTFNEDEIEVDFLTDYLGLGLLEVNYRQSRRVIVQSIKSDSESSTMPQIKAGMIIISIGDKVVEGLPLSEVAAAARLAPRPFKMVLRDPDQFFNKLDSCTSQGLGSVVSTQVRPGRGDYAGEILKVERLKRPELCGRSANVGDVLEVKYQGRLEDGTVVDGVKSMTDNTPISTNVYFVLGGSVPDMFPPGWDLALRGMCTGERRRVTLPPSLAYGDKGLKSKGIPPGATVTYDISLVSVNGIAEIR